MPAISIGTNLIYFYIIVVYPSSMNYFSHYYFFQTENPYTTVGSILPDIARFSEGKKKLWIPQNSEIILNQIQKGCDLHYAADHYFHQSVFFIEAEIFIKNLFQKNEIEHAKIRKWFLVHILIEIMIDRVLIKKHPKILDTFYADFNAVDLKFILMYLEKCERKGLEKFADFFQKFVDSKFMFSYTTEEGVLASLDRILQKTKQEKMPKNYVEKLMAVFPEIENYIEKHIAVLSLQLRT